MLKKASAAAAAEVGLCLPNTPKTYSEQTFYLALLVYNLHNRYCRLSMLDTQKCHATDFHSVFLLVKKIMSDREFENAAAHTKSKTQ